MSDPIDRQAAIDVLEKIPVREFKISDDGLLDALVSIGQVYMALKQMPPAQSERRWIPCSERLPKYGEPVLWCNEKGSVFTTAITFVNERGDFAVGKRHRRYSVVAWQPLPEPYRGDDTE